ncbi:hypothetical protein [Bowmanella yangjiangensis]|uniref:Uncharacterized protein n=1 Tax=Bowmanella yangjiangensis TaxID=2811230 RepID=A0ABS3CNK3_9ALTE|nr:hypothetical protein [Bowmanella yangjiangensis]MBN7818692.1 hypothetical protein [Bowmanella yangjiangensis]
MTKEQMIIALQDVEQKFKRNHEVIEEVWDAGSPFMSIARQQAARVMEEEIATILRAE